MVKNERIDEQANRHARRGPEPRDPEWSALLSTAKRNIPNDEERNREMVDEWRTVDAKWRGCAINTKDYKRAEGESWRASMYLAGEQRVIMRGTLFQCARVYDAALIRFAPFRTMMIDIKNDNNFNFGLAQAKADQGDPEFVALFCSIEACLKNNGFELLTLEQRDHQRVFHKAEYKHAKLTVSGRIEERLDRMFQLIADIAASTRATQERIASLEGRIAILISQLAHHTPIGNLFPPASEVGAGSPILCANEAKEETFGGLKFCDLSAEDKERANQGIIVPDHLDPFNQ